MIIKFTEEEERLFDKVMPYAAKGISEPVFDTYDTYS